MAQADKPVPVVNVPNALTVLRLLMTPVFGWMLLSHPFEANWRWLTAAVFVVALLTDLFDGKIARGYGLITNFGKLWDPIADKAITGMAFIGLSILGELPWWITIVILVREWGITVMRFAIINWGVMAANRGGKMKTMMQTIALVAFLILPVAGDWLLGLPGGDIWYLILFWLAWGAVGIAFVLTVLTGLDYIWEAKKLHDRYVAALQPSRAISGQLADREVASLPAGVRPSRAISGEPVAAPATLAPSRAIGEPVSDEAAGVGSPATGAPPNLDLFWSAAGLPGAQPEVDGPAAGAVEE